LQGANRWSKPHVSALSMHRYVAACGVLQHTIPSLMELRTFLKRGTVFLDLEASNLREIMEVRPFTCQSSGWSDVQLP
jgi:hypothetical protein